MTCLAGADPAQNLTGSNGNPKNFDHRKVARKFFMPARGVREYAPPENFENPNFSYGLKLIFQHFIMLCLHRYLITFDKL